MTPKEKAEEMVNEYRMTLMNEDTECGNEILCTMIAVKCALVAVEEILNSRHIITDSQFEYNKYWNEVKTEIEKL